MLTIIHVKERKMNPHYGKGWQLFGVLLVLVSIGLSSCAQNPLIPLSEAEVADLADSCQEMVSQHISAWDSRDVGQLREVYAEDIVHFDGGPAYVGIEEVSDMASQMWVFFGDWQMAPGESYISMDDCLGTWENWDVMGFEQDDPGLEFDLIEFQDGKISFWRLFYEKRWYFSPVDEELLNRVAEIWSEDTTPALEEIYAGNAIVEDSLLGVKAVGLDEISAYIKSIKKNYSADKWGLVVPFSESENPDPDLQPANGGVYQITTGRDDCSVKAVLILSANQEGKIAHQMTLYQADSLLECGWLTD
jgi:hypothetical protein